MKWRSLLIRLVLLAGAGLFHGTSWVFPGFWPGMWLGHVCLTILAVISSPRQAFLAGSAVGCIGLGWAFSWAPEALSLCLDATWLGARGVYALLVVWESIQFGLFAWLSARLALSGVRAVIGIPFAWAAVEYWWPKIFPWVSGYTQLEILPLLQIAELTGPVGIGFAITAVTAIPAAVVMWSRRTDSAAGTRWLFGYSLGATLLFAGVIGFGFLRLGQWHERLERAPKLRVAIVQIDPSKVGSDAKLRERTLALSTPVDLICWPESAIGTYDSSLKDFCDPNHTHNLSRYSRDSLRPSQGFPCDLLAGGRTYSAGTPEEGPYFMTGYLINPQEQIIGRYHKRTLLPFGEYVPGQDRYPELRQWATLNEITSAGTDARPLTASRGTRLGIVICYEDLLPRNARETVAEGAEILFSLINATAFEQPLTLDQHERIARLRAVENRRFLVRCSSTGITCIVSPTGQIVAQLERGVESTLIHEVSTNQEETPFTRFGDFFPWICTVGLLVCLVATRRSCTSSPPSPPHSFNRTPQARAQTGRV